jgi:hypothetical protein
MRNLFLLAVVAFWVLSIAVVARAQVSSSAFDPQCYQPTVGDPGVIDTIYGSRDKQYLGGDLFNVGPRYGESYGRIMTDGFQKDTSNFSSVRTGPAFNIHKLQVEKNMNFTQSNHPIFGHFHSPHLTDLLIQNQIYWSDDSGNYDENRSSFLTFRSHGDSNYGPNFGELGPYVAYLTSDSLQDIVIGCTSSWQKTRPDTGYIMLFKGSKSFAAGGKFVYPDSELAAPYLTGIGARGCLAGDFRGSGKEDCIAYEVLNNLYFYKNEGPFSLQKFSDAIQFDTLYSRSDNPQMKPNISSWTVGFPLKAFAKASWDKSVDFFGSVLTTDDKNGAQLFFRGGRDFGSKRLFLDSVDFVMHSPRYLDNHWQNLSWADEIWNCGDMTGTGNTVICAHGSDDGSATNFYYFYVLGRAMDEKVDMYYSMSNYGTGYIDTLVADRDSLQDIINGLVIFTSDDDRLLHNWWGVGSLQVIHGSKQIPVHISAKYGVASGHNSTSVLSVYPNPIRNHFQADFRLRESGNALLRIFDLLGREVYREIFRGTAGEQVKRVQLPRLANGVYQLLIERGPEQLRTKIVIAE